MKKEKKNIYTLSLYESVEVTTELIDIIITRVPGGWIHTTILGDIAGVFVPYNKEYKADLEDIPFK